MATAASIEPTDRSMLRVTMISTMPVAMMATTDVCTERFHRFRAVRNVPPESMWKRIHMTARAAIIPSRRVSISAMRKRLPIDRDPVRGVPTAPGSRGSVSGEVSCSPVFAVSVTVVVP